MTITREKHTLPAFNEKAGGWLKGTKLSALITQECTATGLLQPDSIVVRAEDGTIFAEGTDYALDGLWGTIGRLESGEIAAEQPVYIDYTYAPARLDAIVVNQAGQVRLIPGEPGLGTSPPPAPGADERLIGTVWLPGNAESLTE